VEHDAQVRGDDLTLCMANSQISEQFSFHDVDRSCVRDVAVCVLHLLAVTNPNEAYW
jgi:hypothetical protein